MVTIVGLVFVTVMGALPVAAQTVAERVLQDLADELVPAGVLIKVGSKAVSDGSVEWRNVTIAMPRIKGRLAVDVIRAVEGVDGDVMITYPKQMRGIAVPVKGLPPMAMTVSGVIDHVIEKPGRAQVHHVRTEQVSIGFANTEPQAKITAQVTEFKLVHTEEIGVPLKASRIRDIPMSGALDLDLKGVLRLLDALVKLGEISTTQAEVGQMVAGPFFEDGSEGSDHLTAKIQLRENGALLINGDPL